MNYKWILIISLIIVAGAIIIIQIQDESNVQNKNITEYEYVYLGFPNCDNIYENKTISNMDVSWICSNNTWNLVEK